MTGLLGATWAHAASGGTVEVPAGATLDQLAATYGVTAGEIAAANGISNPNLVLAGSDLSIPAPAPGVGSPSPSSPSSSDSSQDVQVTWGQTLWSISTRYDTSVAALANANGIVNPNYIEAGQVLVVPPAGAAQDSSSPSQSSVGTFPTVLLDQPDLLALRPTFLYWASQFGVPPRLLEAMCWWESGWQASIVSSTGAIGVGQLEPGTVTTLQRSLDDPGLDPWVPYDNIEMSAAFLSELIDDAGGDLGQALAYYYQGEKSVDAEGLVPSTRNYVAGILAYSADFSW